MKRFLRFLFIGTGFLLLLVLLVVVVYFIIMALTEYNPRAVSKAEVYGHGRGQPTLPDEFSFLTWNIGYAGLGKEMDFFYDGGKQVIPEKKLSEGYLEGIKKEIHNFDTLDFLYIQEIDIKSRRAYDVNELDELAGELPQFHYVFGMNYNSWFVPVPLYQPMGYVKSGISTFSRHKPESVVMVPFGTHYSWPQRLVQLKRCFLMMKILLENGKELVVINTHNSAYDSTGELRKNELQMLSRYMLKEYEKGNYVVTGGDWNSNPEGFRPQSIVSGDSITRLDVPVSCSFFPGWHFAFDTLQPSNRFTNEPYKTGKTKTTIIDFFVVSPNIEILSVETKRMGFKYSDHEPVIMKIKLIKNGKAEL